MLKNTFIELLTKYPDNKILINELWVEIEKSYSNKNRHYHTLSHLENLLSQLVAVKNEIKDWDTILFSLYYHDFVYNSLKSNNEEKSADFAEKRMIQISVPIEMIQNCLSQILATKAHHLTTDDDTNFFIDADLSILGSDWETYVQYFRNVRKEYSIYPDFIYNLGRKKALNHFLAMNRIFKTDFFYNKFERQAKLNLQNELKLLC